MGTFQCRREASLSTGPPTAVVWYIPCRNDAVSALCRIIGFLLFEVEQGLETSVNQSDCKISVFLGFPTQNSIANCMSGLPAMGLMACLKTIQVLQVLKSIHLGFLKNFFHIHFSV